MSSVKRLEEFFAQQEVLLAAAPAPAASQLDGCVAVLEDATLSWSTHEDNPVLRNVNLRIPDGQVTMICGRTASGKSTLLQVLLGEADIMAGECRLPLLDRPISYLSQDAWVQPSLSIRSNILVDASFDPALYKSVLQATALDVDVARLANGENSAAKTLSGGQRQRLALARALYRNNAETVILDDWTSALDAHTASHVWTAILGPQGMLRGKTVIMATNAMHLLPFADLVVRLADGTIQETGKFEELSIKGKSLIHRASIDSQRQNETNDATPEAVLADNDDIEAVQAAGVQWKTYWFFVKACGVQVFAGYALLSILESAFWVLQPLELNLWTASNAESYGQHQVPYLIGALVITLGLIGCLPITSYYSTCWMFPRAGIRLHELELRGALGTSLSFFHDTSPGRIVSRFSQDLFMVDSELSWYRE